MPNSLYNQLNNGFAPQNSSLQQMMNNFGGFQKMMTQFNSFKNSLQGNPQQIVQGLLQTGKMSQEQYMQLSQMASQFKNLLYKG